MNYNSYSKATVSEQARVNYGIWILRRFL